MLRKISLIFIVLSALNCSAASADKILIPMDASQTDHLKAYGVAYHSLEEGRPVEWLLNYRGGSFLLQNDSAIAEYALLRGVRYEVLGNFGARQSRQRDRAIQHVERTSGKGAESSCLYTAEQAALG